MLESSGLCSAHRSWILDDILALVGQECGELLSFRQRLNTQDGNAEGVAISEIEQVREGVTGSYLQQVDWNIARDARRDRIHELVVVPEVSMDVVADSELIEVISVPIKNLEDCGAELFEGGLV